MSRTAIYVLLALAALPLAATAQTVNVEVANNQPAGGFSFTPVWHAFHDGTFDAFDQGAAASPGIELIAELGDPSTLGTEFGGAGVAGVLPSPAGPPPYTPGQSDSTNVNVGDATTNRYFSFASMVVPSNDLFIGNEDPTAIEVFDAGGNFLGPITIEVLGSMVWDAGTEVNDVNDGPAFVVGQDGTMGTAEGGTVQPFFSLTGADAYMTSLDGVSTPAGYDVTDLLTRGEVLATITITPEPTSLALLALGGVALSVRRRR